MNPKVSSTTSTASASKPKEYFYFLDALRGVAALWVVLFHAPLDERIALLTSSLPHWLVVGVFEWGGLGVAIFFVLSGFVIAHSLREAKIDLSYFGRFSLRRLARLTPPYYVSIVVALAFAFLSSHVKGEAFAPGKEPLSFPRLLTHLFYLQDIFRLPQINEVYWTLCIEVQFYLIFCALLGLAQWLNSSWNLRYARSVVFVPAAVLAALFPIGLLGDNSRPFFFLPLWYGFLLGVFAYWSWRDKLKPILFYSYSALLLAAGVVKSTQFTIGCVIVAVLILEVARANRMQVWLKWRGLQFLGHISYSLYLTHSAIYGAAFFLGIKLLHNSAFSQGFSLLLGIIASVGFAALMWELVEKPSINLSQKVKLVKKKGVIRV
ncbi:acyltransferase [Brasilonema octagenarum UFV-E1]|uniref:Acyltransferase n=1 Tax=Brasilonema sennae CENA114 TaxID=415709 RepID=A0A856MD91_9CYAN|nr:acyltransferase [Brasilonema sennae]QDL06936.1 acyltransferase [Brasilonema sennae CENA114]QDL13299.1 acyltransferase [Brasilonema octagenarum UFV-E1]